MRIGQAALGKFGQQLNLLQRAYFKRPFQPEAVDFTANNFIAVVQLFNVGLHPFQANFARQLFISRQLRYFDGAAQTGVRLPAFQVHGRAVVPVKYFIGVLQHAFAKRNEAVKNFKGTGGVKTLCRTPGVVQPVTVFLYVINYKGSVYAMSGKYIVEAVGVHGAVNGAFRVSGGNKAQNNYKQN